jgi:tetratricopeptide (TPR) repeat protein/tRNA A-37 threonylcarbamoyl transferase component Bud32
MRADPTNRLSREQQLGRACADLDRRVRAGEARPAEAVLAAYPALAGDVDAAVELVYTEFVTRDLLGQRPDPGEWYARFPQHAGPLQRLFQVHETLAPEPTAADVAVARPEPGGETGTRRFGDYELLGEIGRGGMGVVYKARQPGLDRVVALKMILAGEYAHPDEQARFRTEARAAARLHHPHIVQVHEVGEQDGRPFLSMEYVEGGTLERRLAQAALPAREAAALMRTLAQAVQHAHDHGVVHRDLKPANILLGSGEAGPRGLMGPAGPISPPSTLHPKITDFGLAKWSEARATTAGAGQATASGALLGTPSYMAPEQAGGGQGAVGPAADTYALGAILYECLTGRPPFKAETPLETLLQVKHQEPVPPRALNPSVPRDLDTICLQCLHKEPRRRYPSAAGLADDLGHFLAGEPIRARPVGNVERLWRWCWRKPAHAGLAAAVGLLLLGAVTAPTVGLLVLRAEQVRTHAALAAEAKRRQQAREALDLLAERVVEEWRAGPAELTPERRQFLERLLACYEEFAADTGDDEAARTGLAGAHFQVGNLLYRLGRMEPAKQALGRGRELYARLAEESASPEYKYRLAGSHALLGLLHRETGRVAEAEQACRAALTLRQELARDFPDRAQYRLDLARDHVHLGAALQTARRLRDAEAAYRDAMTVLQPVAAASPEHAEARHTLAAAYQNLSFLLQARKELPQALEACRAAAGLLEQLAAESPRNLAHSRDLARCQNQLGLVLRSAGRPGEAEAAHQAARKRFQQLAADWPAVPDYQNGLAGTLVNLAIVHRQRKEFPAARRLLDQALPHHRAALEVNPDHPAYREFYRNNRWEQTLTLLQMGDHVAAADTAAELAAVAVEPAEDHYRAARYLARCATLAARDRQLPKPKREEAAGAYADRALATLRQAVRHGFRDVARLKGDTVLDPLRPLPNFASLLADLEAEEPGTRPPQ